MDDVKSCFLCRKGLDPKETILKILFYSMKIPLNDTLWHTMTPCDIFDVVINLEMSGVRGYLNIFSCADDSSKLDGHVSNHLF